MLELIRKGSDAWSSQYSAVSTQAGIHLLVVQAVLGPGGLQHGGSHLADVNHRPGQHHEHRLQQPLRHRPGLPRPSTL